MRAIPLSLIVAALIPAFTASSFAGSSAPDAKAAVSITDSAWSSTILGFGVKTNDSYTDGNVFLTVPLMSTIGRDGKLGGDYLFIEPYSSVGKGGEVAASLGLAWRHLFNNQSVAALQNKGRASFMEEGWFVGGNLFMDMLNTQHNNQFWQLGVGAEVGNRYLQFSGNYYIPLNGRELAERNVSSQSFSSTSNNTQLTSAENPFAAGNAILQNATYTTYANTTTTTVRTVSELFEQGMQGWDAQLAALVPWVDQWVDLKLIGGYFSFDNQPFGPQKGGTGKVHGWKAGTEFRPVPAVVLSAMWYQDERLTGGNWTVGAQLQIPLGKDWKDSFKPRRRHLVEDLAEPVHRQNDAVKIGNDEEHHSTTSVKHTTRVVKKTDAQIVLKDDIIFVNNGPAVGNGIQAGNDQTGTGKAEHPFDTIQVGATHAGDLSTSTNRVWNVYSQGGSNKFVESDYFENVVTTGSTNFIGSGRLIQGVGGKTFGTGPMPMLAGSISSKNHGYLGVTAYNIGQGTPHEISAENVSTVFLDGNKIFGFGSTGNGIDILNVTNLTVKNNAIDFINSGDGIHVVTDDGQLVPGTAVITGNIFSGVTGISGSAIVIETLSSSKLTASVLGNNINAAGTNGIRLESFNGSTLDATVAGNTNVGNKSGSGIFARSHDDSTFGIKINGNTSTNTDASGIRVVSEENSQLTAEISGNTTRDTDGNGINLESYGTSILKATGTGNTLGKTTGTNSGIFAYSEADSELTASFSGNSITDASQNGIHLQSEDASTLKFTGNNFVITNSGATYSGIYGESHSDSELTATFNGNTINNASDNGIQVESFDTSTLTLNSVSGNHINNSTSDGFNAISHDGSTLALTSVSSNTIIGALNGITVSAQNTTAATGITATLTGNTVTNTTNNGFDLGAANFAKLTITATSNTINTTAGLGISVLSDNTSSVDATVNSNTISNTTLDGLSAISLLGSALSLNASSNFISNTGATKSGIHLVSQNTTAATGITATLTGNHVSSTSVGVFVNTTNASTTSVTAFDSNIINGSTFVGIALQPTAGNVLNFNGTLNNTVLLPGTSGRMNTNPSVNGTFKLNGVTVPSNVNVP